MRQRNAGAGGFETRPYNHRVVELRRYSVVGKV